MRAIPSPIWRTVPTSARSVSTSYCSILSLRIEVISSGRSFTWFSFFSLGWWFETLEPKLVQLLRDPHRLVVRRGGGPRLRPRFAEFPLAALDHVGAAGAHQLDGVEHPVGDLHVVKAGAAQCRVDPVQLSRVRGSLRRWPDRGEAIAALTQIRHAAVEDVERVFVALQDEELGLRIVERREHLEGA